MSADLATAIERMVAVSQSVMDSARPSDDTNECPMCGFTVTEASQHDPDCAYRIARTQISPADLNEARRLVRVLRYDGGRT